MKKKKCYSVQDLQNMLGLSKPTVYKLLQKNVFRWLFIGGKYIIPKDEFDEWLCHGADNVLTFD